MEKDNNKEKISFSFISVIVLVLFVWVFIDMIVFFCGGCKEAIIINVDDYIGWRRRGYDRRIEYEIEDTNKTQFGTYKSKIIFIVKSLKPGDKILVNKYGDILDVPGSIIIISALVIIFVVDEVVRKNKRKNVEDVMKILDDEK